MRKMDANETGERKRMYMHWTDYLKYLPMAVAEWWRIKH